MDTITALILHPNGTHHSTTLNPGPTGTCTDDLRTHVDGWITHLTIHETHTTNYSCWANDDGIALGLDINPIAMAINNHYNGYMAPILGTVVYTGLHPTGDTTTLNPHTHNALTTIITNFPTHHRHQITNIANHLLTH